MEILIYPAAQVVARAAAEMIGLSAQRGATLGLATGATPLLTYQELIASYRRGELSFAQSKAFLLDEYVGLAPNHPQSYHQTIREVFTSHIDIDDSAVHSPDGAAERPWEQAQEYEQLIIDAGGIDLQLLGLGTNGHIAFNEPATSLSSTTRIETLHPQTVADNARYFSSVAEVPTHAITQGLGTILRSGHALLLATGKAKAEAVERLVEGPLSASCPASVLQLHPHATIIVDEAAAAGLANLDYYRYVQTHRPDWQGADGLPRLV
ncbi:glucosamine-6-phosphate deaminase [Corynebacterium alimapuense]|uniref:Glucosamine-6-phosphate deaminase n=1 Tax=Corynebacterium alimapuense TaxID=1576874 RepID=A0A3M8KBE0_9CORY|nr:glucosamine-6-phosphate deaminase [Corynebacterium alimapuense]RNE49864.1 glucosamine-6-phosphate deaminase [Corynebacterium alimapuense]